MNNNCHRIDLSRIPALNVEGVEEVPAYVQICDVFIRLVQNGTLHPGEVLPGENLLADYWNISRATVRRAFRLLEEDGYVVKRQGAETRIANRSSSHHASNLCSSNICMTCEEAIRTVEMKYSIEKCGSFLAKKLGVIPGSEIAACYFVYRSETSAVSSSSVLMSRKLLEACLSDPENEEDIKEFMTKNIYPLACSSRDEIQAYSAKTQSDSSLDIPEADVVISIQEMLYDANERPLAFIKYQLDASCYRLSLTRKTRHIVEIV